MILEATFVDSCNYLCTSPVGHMITGKRMETRVCFFIATRRPSEHIYEKDSERNIFRPFYGRKLQLYGILCFLGGLKAKNNTLNFSLLKLSLKSLVTEDSCITREPNNLLYSTCPSTISFSVGTVWSVRIVPTILKPFHDQHLSLKTVLLVSASFETQTRKCHIHEYSCFLTLIVNLSF